MFDEDLIRAIMCNDTKLNKSLLVTEQADL